MRTLICLSMALWVASVQGQANTTEADSPRLPPFIKPLPADAPKPNTDAHDLRGMWLRLDSKTEQLKTTEGTAPPYTKEAAAKQAARLEATRAGSPYINPAALCRAPGFLWDLGISYFPLRVMQDDNKVVFIFDRFHAIWRIALNQKQASTVTPTYMGHSVGHWEGDVLVVDTTGLRDGLWIDESGSFVSSAAHITSRITKNAQRGELVIVHTIDDPKTYTQPWSTRQRIKWRPDYSVLSEHDCEESSGSVNDAKEYGFRPE